MAQAIVQAQTAVDLRTQARNVDFSSAGSTRPVKTGSSLPAGCVSGGMFFLSSAPAGENLYGCTGCLVFYPSAGTAIDDARNSGNCAVQFDATQNTTTYTGD